MTDLLPFEKLQRKILIRKNAKTDPKFGKALGERTVVELLDAGAINLNKPKGPTSHQVSAYVQKIFNINRTGHSGTLDPRVTGVLPVTLGRATRVVEALLHAGKEYVCIMHLHKLIPEQQLRKAMEEFVGRIKQLPPVKSAVKREWRFRKIYYLDILEIDGQDVLFRVGCQAGTYIRKLCHDIGTKLGIGAHMAELVRTKAGPFQFGDKMFTLQDCEDAMYYYEKEKNEKFLRAMLQPMESAIVHLPKVWVFDQVVDVLCHGSDLKVPGIVKVSSDIQVDEMVGIMTLKDELIALGHVKMTSKDLVTQEKGLAIKTYKVLMQPGVYPKWKREEEISKDL